MIIHPDVIGIDVSKHHLDVFDAAQDRGERLSNEAGAIQALIARWTGRARFVVFEATGRYDRVLRQALEAAGLAHARVNPAKARDFARAAGFLAKTDAVDARMLAAFGAALRPAPAPAIDPIRDRLALPHKRRDQLVAMRQQERVRRAEADDPDLADDLARHLAWLDQAVAEFDRRIADLIADQPDLRQAKALIQSIPGVGPVTAATLMALVPELGQRSPKTIAALAGLAPFNHDPGKQRGQRAIRGGRSASATPSTWPPSPIPLQQPLQNRRLAPANRRKARQARLHRHRPQTPRHRKRHHASAATLPRLRHSCRLYASLRPG